MCVTTKIPNLLSPLYFPGKSSDHILSTSYLMSLLIVVSFLSYKCIYYLPTFSFRTFFSISVSPDIYMYMLVSPPLLHTKAHIRIRTYTQVTPSFDVHVLFLSLSL